MKRERIKWCKLPTPRAVHLRAVSSKPKVAVSYGYRNLALVGNELWFNKYPWRKGS